MKIVIIRRGLKIISDDKGIVSAELLLVTLIFFIIAGSLISLTSSAMSKTETGTLADVRMIGEKTAEAINTVYLNGDGYTINMAMSNRLTYTATISSVNNTGSIKMQQGSKSIIIKLIPNNVQNFTMNSGQRYKIYNNNGTIMFTAL